MSTAVLFGLYFSLAVTGMGIIFTPALLRLLHVPEELMKMTAVYLRIIFIGAPFTYFYNALSSALKSVGDSKTPLKFLMFSSVLNGVLDLIFIGGLGFGIVCSGCYHSGGRGSICGLVCLVCVSEDSFAPAGDEAIL